MTIEDANYLLGLAEANFGYVFRNMTDEQKVMLVHSWAFGLQDIPADIVMMAFMQLTTSCDWLPNVAKIREQVRKLRTEAKQYFSTDHALQALCENTGMKMTPKSADIKRRESIKRYIIDNTKSLDGDAGLKLDTILEGSYITPIGTGRIGFSEIGDGARVSLPPKRDRRN